MLSQRIVVLVLLSGALAACGGSKPTIPTGLAGSTVRLFNDSHFTLTNVHVLVAPDVDVTEASMASGAMSTVHLVSTVYENPSVSLVADGKTLTSFPIEGFAGFNNRLDSGAYVISINVADTPPVLRVTVTQPVADRSVQR